MVILGGNHFGTELLVTFLKDKNVQKGEFVFSGGKSRVNISMSI